MRVASKTIYDMLKFNLAVISQEMNNTSEVVASGKRINNLSDDPVGLTQVLNIKSDLSSIEQMGSNVARGKWWLSASESALVQVEEIISGAKALSIQMASANTGSQDRISATENIQNMQEEILSLVNTSVSGSYIFSGSKIDTIPFGGDGTYNGDSNPFKIKIGKDTTIEVGSDGSAVLGNIFTTFSNLKTALTNDDIGGIQDAITDLGNDFSHITAMIQDVGSKMTRMEIKERIFQELNFSNTEQLSNIEDADIAQAIIDLNAIEFTYQAALQSSSKVMSLSLIDFL